MPYRAHQQFKKTKLQCQNSRGIAEPATTDRLGDEKSSQGDSESDSGGADDRQPEEQEAAEFYDPELDKLDEEWVFQQRGRRKTDAILSCPGCLTTCCIDCQRHETHSEQYRAMFVTNCRVDFAETIVLSSPARQTKKRQRGRQEGNSEGGGQEEMVHPVYCGECDTRLGVYDAEEIFHFLSIVANQ